MSSNSVDSLRESHIKALMRLAKFSGDWEVVLACRILLDSAVGGEVKERAIRRIELFRARMMRVT